MTNERPHPSAMTREELYEMAWSAPMVKLARKYGLSDQGLRKIFVKQQVPIPKAGYWAKVAAGKSFVRPQLGVFSEDLEKKVAKSARLRRESQKAAESLEWRPPPSILSDENMEALFHRSLADIRKQLGEAERGALQLKRIAEWEDDHPRRRHPDRERLGIYDSWQRFCDRGKSLVDTRKRAAVRVSLTHYKRAIHLLSVIIQRAEELGYKVATDSNERIEFSRDDAGVQMRLSERYEHGFRREKNSWSNESTNIKVLSPTGRLTVFLSSRGGSEYALSDQVDNYLEQQIDNIASAINAKHAASVEWEEDYRRRLLAIEERRRHEAEQARLRDIARQEAEAESARRKELLAEAKGWQEAEFLRQYVSELDRRVSLGGTAQDGYEEWRAWAQLVANDLDQSCRRVMSSEKVQKALRT